MNSTIAPVSPFVHSTIGLPASPSAVATPAAPACRNVKSRIALSKHVVALIVFVAIGRGTVEAQLVVTDSDSCVITRTEEFAGAALAGHINGGAELYREYGFKHLTVQYVQMHSGHGDTRRHEGADRAQPPGKRKSARLPEGLKDTKVLRESKDARPPDGQASARTPDEEELVVEAYRMHSPRAAYGIYSISRHECGERDTAFTYSCSGPYQIQCAADSWYVRILNGTGSTRAQAGSRALLRSIARRTGQPRIGLPGLFLSPALDGMRDRVLLMTGALGVQNGLPDWGDLLDGLGRFALYAVRLDEERGIIAELHLAGPEDAALVAQRIGVPTGQRAVQQTTGPLQGYAVWPSPLTLRVLETSAPRSALDELLNALAVAGKESDPKPGM